METQSIIFSDFKALDAFARYHEIHDHESLLIRVHTCIHSYKSIQPFLEELRNMYPKAVIIGGNHVAVIAQGDILPNTCLLSFTKFEHSNLTAQLFDTHQKDGEVLAKEVQASSILKGAASAFLFFTRTYTNIAKFIEASNAFASDVKFCGGVTNNTCMKTEEDNTPFVIVNTQVYTNGLAICSVQNKDLHVYSNAIIGTEQIGQNFTITKCDGCYIEEINNKNASKWYRSYLNEEQFKKDPAISLEFPFILPERENSIRTILYDEEKDMLYWADQVELNEKIRLAYASPNVIIKECRQICEEIQSLPTETIFVYSCQTRNTILNHCCKWELSPFVNTNIAGALCEGEIINIDGNNEYSNCTCSLMCMSEHIDARVHLENGALDKVENLTYDNQHILTYLLKSTNDEMVRTNDSLNRQIDEQNSQILETLFIDAKTKLPNFTKFLYDHEVMVFNKLCIISNKNDVMLRSHYGDTRCNHELTLKIERCRKHLDDPEIYFYQHSQDKLLLCATAGYDDTRFLKKVKSLFTYLGTIEAKDHEFYYVNEFAVVLNENDLLDKAELTLSYVKRSSQRFLLYYPNLGLESELEEELVCLSNIKYALLHDGVIPYFQPIHDNKFHAINKFESLMRLQGKDGTIMMPDQFLGVSKKYKLYEELSRHMIQKVMVLFKDSKYTVTINLSVQDIYSDTTKKLIYQQLQETSTPENVIFEIVESEEIHRDQIFEEFLKRIRSIGAKIAIDDFGSGYNNLLKLVKLNADYIKIDGEIVRNMLNDEKCRQILDTILFLSKQTNTELVAEFVENNEIQEEIERLGIRFSQGYHFAKPKPYKESVKS